MASGLQLAFHTMAILLGLVYCVIQPVMAAIVLLYFMVAYFFNKYQAIYVERPAYESGGLVRVCWIDTLYANTCFKT